MGGRTFKRLDCSCSSFAGEQLIPLGKIDCASELFFRTEFRPVSVREALQVALGLQAFVVLHLAFGDFVGAVGERFTASAPLDRAGMVVALQLVADFLKEGGGFHGLSVPLTP